MLIKFIALPFQILFQMDPYPPGKIKRIRIPGLLNIPGDSILVMCDSGWISCYVLVQQEILILHFIKIVVHHAP